MKVFSAAKYGSVKVFIVAQERRASRCLSWRRSAAKDRKGDGVKMSIVATYSAQDAAQDAA